MLDSLLQSPYYPLLVLLMGLVTVVGMIIVLRVNAFIALITAAVLVSILSGGAPAGMIKRVAVEFGDTAAKIGIVIAMAAVIGKCLMDSGAADRIVRSFLKLLGEERAAAALMSSGFVLSIPVFFDTVFYLLVPLARSLWKRTQKNYVLYVTAIAAGAAITHTLVPPTPGPLVMAGTLDIDIGVMMVIGMLIGFPTAVVGLLVCRVMNRLIDLPMRAYSGDPEPEPLDEAKLPPLWIALAPIVLPVLMISTNTVTKSLADAEHTPRFHEGDIRDWQGLCVALSAEATRPAARVMKSDEPAFLPKETRQAIRQAAQTEEFDEEFKADVRARLDALLRQRGFYEEQAFAAVTLPPAAKGLLSGGVMKLSPDSLSDFKAGSSRDLLGRGVAKLSLIELERFNRLLLEASFPEQIRPHVWGTPLRKASSYTALLGSANLALMLSAAIAMLVLVRRRGLTLKQLAKTTEVALMSGGVIILITAAGGAFGAMLRQCGVRGSVEELVGSGGENMGLIMLCLGFGIASVMKIAQGSGTVSMITTSAIMASLIVPAELGCHPVYLAAAIGAGSLVGSWMNDSGFWIVARMSGLTEIETLKTWTILLAILGVTALGFTLLAAWLLPLA